MIYSNIYGTDALQTYPAAIQAALEFLKSTDILALAPGKYPIQGEELFAVVSDLELKPVADVPAERHCKYIDVQFWPQDGERFGIAPYFEAEIADEGHEDRDVWYYQQPKHESFVSTQKGDFAVFYPWDIHRPGVQADGSQRIHKCVVKVSMDLLKKG